MRGEPTDEARNTARSNVHQRKEGARQWLWFIGIYAASLALFTGVVYLLRWIIA